MSWHNPPGYLPRKPVTILELTVTRPMARALLGAIARVPVDLRGLSRKSHFYGIITNELRRIVDNNGDILQIAAEHHIEYLSDLMLKTATDKRNHIAVRAALLDRRSRCLMYLQMSIVDVLGEIKP